MSFQFSVNHKLVEAEAGLRRGPALPLPRAAAERLPGGGHHFLLECQFRCEQPVSHTHTGAILPPCTQNMTRSSLQPADTRRQATPSAGQVRHSRPRSEGQGTEKGVLARPEPQPALLFSAEQNMVSHSLSFLLAGSRQARCPPAPVFWAKGHRAPQEHVWARG